MRNEHGKRIIHEAHASIAVSDRRSSILSGPRNFLFVDILDFSGTVCKLAPSREDGKFMNEWIEFVRYCALDAGIPLNDIRYVSDTLFVVTDQDHEGLSRLLSFSRCLLERGAGHERRFLLRGAIASGDISQINATFEPGIRETSPMTGQPVIRAHRLEQSTEWVGIVCDEDTQGLGKFLDSGEIVRYKVPVKPPSERSSPTTEKMPVVVWDVRPEALLRGEDPNSIHPYVSNTISFAKGFPKPDHSPGADP